MDDSVGARQILSIQNLHEFQGDHWTNIWWMTTMIPCKNAPWLTSRSDFWQSTHSVLSGSALDALKEFYADRDARQKQFEDLKAGAEADAILSMETFAEDWNQSQFWVPFPSTLPFL